MNPDTSGPSLRVIVVGAGAFGLPAAIELRSRGHDVTVLDTGPLPHPDASTTDISKIVRMDYGTDELYLDMGNESLDRWGAWNQSWTPGLYHQTGFLVLSSEPWEPGSFPFDSYASLLERDQPVELLDPERVRREFPAWDSGIEWGGYRNRRGGWAESGAVSEHLGNHARSIGVRFEVGESFAGFIENGSVVGGVRTEDGSELQADHVVVAAGAWTPTMFPELQDRLWAVGQPVFHFDVTDVAKVRPPIFLPWAADTSTAGWYGFPAKADGRLKVANHGPGVRVDPHGPREVPAGTEEQFRTFLSRALPTIADAPVLSTRLCLYSETFDNDFWIDRDPNRDGVTVATGGSGHGFKFAPVLGGVIADAVEGRDNPWAARFRWRPLGTRRVEPARWVGPDPAGDVVPEPEST